MQNGFTLIEVIIVIGISVVMSAAAVSLYSDIQLSAQLNEPVAQAIQSLRLAREYSRAGYGNSNYGIYFDSNQPVSQDRFIFYKGESYQSRDQNFDQISVLKNSISISTSLSNFEVNFSQGLGMPNNVGQINFLSSSGRSEIMVVNSQGIVTVE